MCCTPYLILIRASGAEKTEGKGRQTLPGDQGATSGHALGTGRGGNRSPANTPELRARKRQHNLLCAAACAREAKAATADPTTTNKCRNNSTFGLVHDARTSLKTPTTGKCKLNTVRLLLSHQHFFCCYIKHICLLL